MGPCFIIWSEKWPVFGSLRYGWHNVKSSRQTVCRHAARNGVWHWSCCDKTNPVLELRIWRKI